MFKVEDISLFKDIHILNKIETNNSSVFICDAPDETKFVVKIYSFEKKKIFLNEIKTYFFVNYMPCVLQLIDFGYRDGYYYIIMPYCEGKKGELSLRDKINKNNLNVTEAIDIIWVIVSALMLIKRKYSGFIHGDIKPENILYYFNFYSLSDFSNSYIIGNQEYITDTTSAYKAPELWGSSFKCEKNDIYSIGLIFYELLTGEHLLSNKELDDEKWASLHSCSESILQSKEKYIDRKDLFVLISKCIKKDYKERNSLCELYEQLIQVCEKSTVNINEQIKNMCICFPTLKELCLSGELFLRKISDMKEYVKCFFIYSSKANIKMIFI